MDKGFTDYIEEHVKDYLPDDYANAEVSLEVVNKSNDRELTGIVIRRPDDMIAPTIYLEQFEVAHRAGRSMEDITQDIAQMHLQNCRPFEFDKECLTDYEKAKPMLGISLCDPENNAKYLEDKAYTQCGALAAIYRLEVVQEENEVGSIAVTNDLLERWGVSLDQLHQDAVAVESMRDPAKLYNMDDMMREVFSGEEGRNLLDGAEDPVAVGGIGMFVLTNESKVNGASVLARDGLMDQVGDVLGQSYFILPSSIHEVILVPDNGAVTWDDLSRMVSEVNDTQVSAEDLLSYKVQRYDREERALQQDPKLEAEEKKEAKQEKKTGVLDQLAENKKKVAEAEVKPAETRKKAAQCR